jgi:alkane 1-monooxygenase
MKLSTLKYLFVYITPLIILFSLWSEDLWSYFALVFIFGLIPFMELFMNGSTENLNPQEEEEAKNNFLFDFILYGLVPLQCFILVYFLIQVGDNTLPLYAKIGMTISYGLACGGIAINAGHELGHRNTWYEQGMSKLLLLSTLYMHFFIEHNRGHHKHVSTDNDPASSRYNENVYSFFLRSIIGGWRSAFRLEEKKMTLQNKRVWSLHNEMLRFQLIQIALITAIAIIFGLETMLCFIVGATIGILILETVNYIEHYGLRRMKVGNRFERTKPIHSWNSNHPLGRILLLELTRHSDHHYISSRKYQTLKHFDNSPQMPTGYPGMMVLALFPPLWFRVMNKRVEEYGSKLPPSAEQQL